MTREEKLYRPLDDFLKRLKKKIKEAYSVLIVSGFDQLNVIQLTAVTDNVYRQLDRFNRKEYEKLVEHAWEWAEEIVGKKISKPDFDEFVRNYISGYDSVTQYVYTKEIDRKRMRLNESILTAREYQDIVQLHKAVKKASDLWFTQSSQYALDLMLEGVKAAYDQSDADKDETKWMWNAVIDGHECQECHDRNGRVYLKRNYPRQPHYGCRCYPTPVR